MGRKKKNTSVVQQTEQKETTPVIEVQISYESDELEPTEKVIEHAKIVVVEKDPKTLALEGFAELWNNLKQYQYMTDADARKVHQFWQVVSGRTDYYVNCGVCTNNHIKVLKKRCKDAGISLK